MSRNHEKEPRIIARDPFRSDGYLFRVSVADREEIWYSTVRNHLAAARFELANSFYPAPGRGRFILKGALPAGRPGFSSSGPGPGISAFYFLEFSSCGPRPFTTSPNSDFLPAGLMVNPALPNGRHRLKMGFISPQRMGFDRHLS